MDIVSAVCEVGIKAYLESYTSTDLKHAAYDTPWRQPLAVHFLGRLLLQACTI